MSNLTLQIIAYSSLGLFLFMMFHSLLIAPLIKKMIDKKNKERAKIRINSLKKGDKILTVSGIKCEFIKIKNDSAHVFIAEKIIIKIDPDSIMGVYK